MIVMKKNLKDWDKIQLVKDFARHVVEVDLGECEIEYEGEIVKTRKVDYIFDDFKLKSFEKIKAEYADRKAEESRINNRIAEIELELKNELLTKAQRTFLANEFNDLKLKFFDNNDDELYEALDLLLKESFSRDLYCSIKLFLSKNKFSMSRNYRLEDLTEDERVKEINMLILAIKKIIKYGYSFDVINIYINAMLQLELENDMIKTLDKCYDVIETNLSKSEYLKLLLNEYPPISFNLYSIFIDLMSGISIDKFIQYYPLEKKFEGHKWGWKDYYSSIEAIERIKNEYGDVLTKESAKILLNEALFSEHILFEIAVQMFHVIEYDTDINSLDFIIKLLEESRKEDNAPKRKLKVIK